jgi:hypothetical protein
MLDNAQLLDRVEHAIDDEPFCPICSAPTRIEEQGGRVWLVCSASPAPVGILARMTRSVLPHEQRLVADLRKSTAA